MKVPFIDLKASYDELKTALDEAYQRVMDSGWYLLGHELEEFESAYASYCGVMHCVGVGSGLDALHLALRAYDIGPGDEVIVPANTYIATWLAVSYAGALPVPVEPDPSTCNIDPTRVEEAITAATRAIIPVHLYGQPADMDPIMDIARSQGLKVIEDNAQAQGALYKGRATGGLSDAAGTSFYPGKNLGAFGDGGAITSNDPRVAELSRSLRNYGSDKKYHHVLQGFNARLDELQAAFLCVKLKMLDKWNQSRRKIASRYQEAFVGTSLTLPAVCSWASPVWHQYTVRHPLRDEIQEAIEQKGVGTLIHYPIPPHLQRAYAHLGYAEGDFPVAEKIHREILSLPIGPHLTEQEQDYVINVVLNAVEAHGG
jgi:dTDP-4-amino-4,6-dideoxygalactose transaminase